MGMINILVVEDEAFIGMNIRRRLEHIGYHVIMVVPSGDEAFQISTEKAPDLVVMDIQLEGGLDGLETAQTLWNRFQIPIVIVTGNIDSNTRMRADQTWCYGFVSKPFFSNELEVAVSKALDRIFTDRYCKKNNYLLNQNYYHPVSDWMRDHPEQFESISDKVEFLNDLVRFHGINLFYSLAKEDSNGLHKVDSKEYFSRLIYYTWDKFKKNVEYQINIQIDIHSIDLDEKVAIPLGIIIFEAVSNAIKYAFTPDHVNSSISVKLSIKPNREHFCLQIKDNGLGFNNIASSQLTEEIMENPNSLGLYLIKCMAQIIQADSMLNGDVGTCLEILVPYKPQER